MGKQTEKHIPQRMCVACRKMQPQNELIRFVCSNGVTEIDMEKKKFGRGAYICKDNGCLAKAAKRNMLSRHFKCSVPNEIYVTAGETIPVRE